MSRTKKALVFILALLFATTGITLGLVYWSRTIQHSITVIGIDAELLQGNFDGYDQKIVAENLVDGKVSVVIIAENFYEIWLNVSWTSQAEGLDADITGQYYDVYWGWSTSQGNVPIFTPLATPFTIINTESCVVEKAQMMLVDLTKTPNSSGNHGYCLVVSFVWDTELVTIPGDYTVDILFQMGFV